MGGEGEGGKGRESVLANVFLWKLMLTLIFQ